MKISIKILLIFIILFISNLVLSAQNAKDIFLKATKQLVYENIEMEMEISSTDKKGRVKEKGFNVLLAKFGENEKMKVTWKKPERAKGTTIIITSPANETGVIEVFTPSNGKVRKLKATDENMNMVGSEFSMMNLNMGDAENLDFNYLGQDKIEGKTCHKIEVSEKEPTNKSKGVFLIEENTYQITQINVYDDKGRQTTLVNLSDFQPVANLQDKIQPMKIISKDLVKHKQSDIKVVRVVYRADITEADFKLSGQIK